MAAPPLAAPPAAPAPPPPAGAAVARSIRGGGLNLAGSLANAATAFVLVALVTNRLGAGPAGTFLAVTNAGLLAANLLKLGAEHGSVYSLAGPRTAARGAAGWRVVAVATLPPTLAATAVAVAVAVAARPLAAAVLGDGDHAGLVLAATVGIPPFVAGTVLLGATRGLGTMGPTVRWGQLARPFAQLATVGAGLVAGASLGWLVLAWTLPLWLLPVGATVELVRLLGPPSTGADPLPWRAFWAYTAPRAVADGAAASLERLDIVLIAAMSGPVATSLYSAANRLTNVAVVAMHAVGQAAAPELRAAHAVGDRPTLDRVARAVTNHTVTLLWPLAVHLSLQGGAVLGVFGPEFHAAAGALAVLAIGLAAAVTLGPGDVLVLMTGRSGRSLVNHLVAVGIDVVLVLILVPRHGALGAAVAWSAAILTMRVLSVVEVWRRERVRGVGADGVRLAAAAVAAHATGVGIVQLLPVAGLAGAAAGGAVGCALHAALVLGTPALRSGLHLPVRSRSA